jgi:hypothetical protein
LVARGVVLGARLGIGKRLIGKLDLLETLHGAVVVAMQVRMRGFGLPPVRRLQGGLIDIAGYA